MNYALKNLISVLLILFILGFGYFYLFARQSGQYMPESWADFDCMYPTSISTDQLQPTLLKGSILMLNRCVKESTLLSEGDIILFKNDGLKKIGVITGSEAKGSTLYYTVQVSNQDDDTLSVSRDEIIAFTKLPSES